MSIFCPKCGEAERIGTSFLTRVPPVVFGSHKYKIVDGVYCINRCGICATLWDGFGDSEPYTPPAPDPSRFPHTCPTCSSPAYIGCTPAAFECSNKECKRW